MKTNTITLTGHHNSVTGHHNSVTGHHNPVPELAGIELSGWSDLVAVSRCAHQGRTLFALSLTPFREEQRDGDPRSACREDSESPATRRGNSLHCKAAFHHHTTNRTTQGGRWPACHVADGRRCTVFQSLPSGRLNRARSCLTIEGGGTTKGRRGRTPEQRACREEIRHPEWS